MDGVLVSLLFATFLACGYAEGDCPINPADAQCCREVLRPGQFYCTSPRIDLNSQSEADCTPSRLVNVSCFAAPNVTCTCGGVHVPYNESQCVFQKEQPCRYVKGRRYDYRVAVALSLFLGLFGIDRFYLGYPAIGLLKLCTLGFFLIGHMVDFLLILIQVVGPADRSDYYAPFYGPLLNRIGVFVPVPENDTISSTCLSNYTTLGMEELDMGM